MRFFKNTAEKLALILLFSSSISFTNAQIELATDKVSWNFTVEQNGCEATIIGKVRVVPHWHINALKLPKGSFGFATSLTFKKSNNYSLVGGVIEPKPIEKYDEYADENLAYHEGNIVFKQKIKITSEKDFEISGVFNFQTCNDVKCLPDHVADFKVKLKGCKVDKETTSQNKLISEFIKIDNDEAKHKNGSDYVLVNGIWSLVPEGNSIAFYKKYLSIIQKNEK
jgi:thiol:disulfide interchange protein DsbD